MEVIRQLHTLRNRLAMRGQFGGESVECWWKNVINEACTQIAVRQNRPLQSSHRGFV